MEFHFYLNFGILLAAIVAIAIRFCYTRPRMCKRHKIEMETRRDEDPFSAPNVVTPPPTYNYCPECKKETREQTL